jgi:hypothetical protein
MQLIWCHWHNKAFPAIIFSRIIIILKDKCNIRHPKVTKISQVLLEKKKLQIASMKEVIYEKARETNTIKRETAKFYH